MTPPLFLVDHAQLDADLVVLAGRDGHHAADVRRLRVGEPVEVTDGSGARLRCRVRDVVRGQVTLTVEQRTHEPAPRPRVEVAQALIKHDAADRALAGMTEVGVDRIVPWAAHHCVVAWTGDRVQRGVRRWRSTVAEAAKQSRRAWLPEVTEPVSTVQLAERVRAADLALLLDVDGVRPLASVDVPDEATVLLVVGPEGGQTAQETSVLVDAGAQRVHLGPSVLRSATAATAATAALLSRTPRWMIRHPDGSAG